MRGIQRFLQTQVEAVGHVLLSPETVALWPFAVALSTVFSLAQHETVPHHDCTAHDDSGAAQASSLYNDAKSSLSFRKRPAELEHGGELESYYIFAQWTSSTGFVFFIVMLYIGLVLITNLVACYRFFYVWNTVMGSYRADRHHWNSIRTSSQTCLEALRVVRYHENEEAEKPEECPICLLDLEDQQWVTSCEEGCGRVFHKDCLFQWLQHTNLDANDDDVLQYNTSCPCCRKEMLQGRTSSCGSTTSSPTNNNNNINNGRPAWLSDLSTFMGYYGH